MSCNAATLVPFNLENKKKLQGSKEASHLIFGTKLENRQSWVSRRIVMVNEPRIVSPQLWSLFGNFFA